MSDNRLSCQRVTATGALASVEEQIATAMRNGGLAVRGTDSPLVAELVAIVRREVEAAVQKERASHRRALSEALNSGDGSYKP